MLTCFIFVRMPLFELDIAEKEVTANFPIYFAIQLVHFFGLSIQDNYSAERNHFNISEGNFTDKSRANDTFLDAGISYYFSQLLKVLHPSELKEIKLNKDIRRTILSAMENYYIFHIAEFSTMKTLPILHELIG